MIPLRKLGQRPFNFTGITLVELSFAVVVLAILLSSIAVVASGFIQRAKAIRTISEMDALAESCRQYYSANSLWPSDLNVLYPEFIKRSTFFNLFGNAYLLVTTNKTVSISTNIPRGLVTQNAFGNQLIINPSGVWDTTILTKSLPDEGLDSLKYDKKYIYQN